MKKYAILFIAVLFTAFRLNAATAYNDSTEMIELDHSRIIDSLTNLWYQQQMSPGSDTSFVMLDNCDSLYIPDFPDSIYSARLAALPLVMDMTYNSIVRNYIHMYTHKKRDLVEKMLGLGNYYFPIFEEILDANDMPMELKYLSVIESALNPNAVSRVGATGMWQFMYYTGKSYHLEINSFVDERRDPIKATYAAINYMNDLYDIYEDWILVIAAYNCGPGNVNKAIRRSGGKKNYWDIYYMLPRETRGYVPAFIAATYIMNYYHEHNLTPQKAELPIMCDTIMINDKVHFEQIAHFMDISVDELRSLNPQFRRDIIPGNSKPYSLRLPYNKTLAFIDNKDSIVAYNDSVYFNPAALAKTPEYNTYVPGPPSSNHVKLTYTVKSGDNLGFISAWYNVSLSNLRYWNNIHGNKIHAGQKLAIYVHESKVSKYENINSMTFAQKQASVGKTSSSNSNTVTASTAPLKAGEFEYYTVKRGDTLWDIAKQFPGVSDTEIMQWNGISDASRISVGQKLKIKIKG